MTESKKKFRQWDQKVIFNNLQKAVQIIYAIEEKCHEERVNPANLPLSLLSTGDLFDLCASYAAMYDKLLQYDLIESGYPKNDLTIKH